MTNSCSILTLTLDYSRSKGSLFRVIFFLFVLQSDGEQEVFHLRGGGGRRTRKSAVGHDDVVHACIYTCRSPGCIE